MWQKGDKRQKKQARRKGRQKSKVNDKLFVTEVMTEIKMKKENNTYLCRCYITAHNLQMLLHIIIDIVLTKACSTPRS